MSESPSEPRDRAAGRKIKARGAPVGRAAAPRTAASRATGTRPATSYDVARHAGVSQSAVSRCFKPGGSVSPGLRQRVEKSARTLGYRPNAIARGLTTRRSNFVAVLMSRMTALNMSELLVELTARFERHGIRALLFVLEKGGDVEQVLEQVLAYQVDGVISAVPLSAAGIGLFQAHCPVILFNHHQRSLPVSRVSCDHLQCGEMLVERLLAGGHTRFGLIDGPADSTVGIERIAGAKARLAQAGLSPVAEARGAFDYPSGAQALAELMRQAGKSPPTAILAANDAMAIGALDHARHVLGLKVPEALSVVGIDGIGPADWLGLRLTTVRQPLARMAEAAVSLMLERIANPGGTAEVRMFSGELIRGGSARLG